MKSLSLKKLPIAQRLGIICLIFKGEKDKRYLRNWRTLTLFEIFYKLLSAILAKRLKPILDKLLGYEQKAYIPGRFMAECTRTMYDLFEHAKENNLPGMMLIIDFEKAFDSVNFDFILTTLDIFNFGENFKEQIRILLGMNDDANFQAVPIVNGNISKRLNVARGCRQGDPISGYLFILAIEILALTLKKSKAKAYRT